MEALASADDSMRMDNMESTLTTTTEPSNKASRLLLTLAPGTLVFKVLVCYVSDVLIRRIKEGAVITSDGVVKEACEICKIASEQDIMRMNSDGSSVDVPPQVGQRSNIMRRLVALCSVDYDSIMNESKALALFSAASVALRSRCKINLVHGFSAYSLISKELAEFVQKNNRYYAVLLQAREEDSEPMILMSHEQGILVACLCAIDEKGTANSDVKEKQQQRNTIPNCTCLSLSTLLDCLGEFDAGVKITDSLEQQRMKEIILRLGFLYYLLLMVGNFVAEGIRSVLEMHHPIRERVANSLGMGVAF